MTLGGAIVTALSTYEGFGSLLSSGDKRLLFVDLHPEWCGPCSVMVPTFEQMLNKSKELEISMKLDILSVSRELMVQWMAEAPAERSNSKAKSGPVGVSAPSEDCLVPKMSELMTCKLSTKKLSEELKEAVACKPCFVVFQVEADTADAPSVKIHSIVKGADAPRLMSIFKECFVRGG